MPSGKTPSGDQSITRAANAREHFGKNIMRDHEHPPLRRQSGAPRA
jgi:hypothetical protein